MEHKYKVGDMVTSLVTEFDVTEGCQYKVVEVDDNDDVCPVRILDNNGDRFWMLNTDIKPYTLTTTDQYTHILEVIAGPDVTAQARKIHEALQDAS